jgi:uncharacterized damage-inducible protein DinB
MTSNELLQYLEKQVENQRNFVAKEVDIQSENNLLKRPNPQKWNILECLAHLNQYAAFYVPQLEKATKNSKSTKNKAYKQGWLGGKFISMMEPQNVKPQKTMKHTNTFGRAVTKKEIETFISWQDRLLRAVQQLRDIDLNKRQIPVEFMPLIKLKTGDALQFVVVHQQRHIEQIKALLLKTEIV